jgi:hypothetical protein
MILDLLNQNSFSIDSLTNNGISTKNASIDDQREQVVLLTIKCSLITTKLIVIFPHEFIQELRYHPSIDLSFLLFLHITVDRFTDFSFLLRSVAEPGGGRRGLSPLQKGLSPP